jgi:hypothetical protein
MGIQVRNIGVLLLGVLVLSSCANTAVVEPAPIITQSSAVAEEPIVEEQELISEWLAACEDHVPIPEGQHSLAYEAVIIEVCGKANPDGYLLPHLFSPTVSQTDSKRYLDGEAFHESYWVKRMNPDFPVKMRIIFSEKDGEWWKEQQVANLIDPELGWFTSKDEGGHCRVLADIFCPKFYGPSDTTTGIPTEFRIIGSKLSWEDWQLTNSAHESVHLYQDSHGQSHWTFWYIEGQATFFELALARLLFDQDDLRTGSVFSNPQRTDSLKLVPTSSDTVAKYLKDCENSRNGECDSFKYGGGSLFHEKLVIDFGLERYFEWQDFLNEQMPKGNPANFDAAQGNELAKTFDKSFEEIFGFSQREFETEIMPAYIFEVYN